MILSSRERLLAVASAYTKAGRLSLPRVSTIVANDGKLFKRLENGGGATLRTYDSFMSWFSANWPDGVEWPVGIERPAVRVAE